MAGKSKSSEVAVENSDRQWRGSFASEQAFIEQGRRVRGKGGNASGAMKIKQ